MVLIFKIYMTRPCDFNRYSHMLFCIQNPHVYYRYIITDSKCEDSSGFTKVGRLGQSFLIDGDVYSITIYNDLACGLPNRIYAKKLEEDIDFSKFTRFKMGVDGSFQINYRHELYNDNAPIIFKRKKIINVHDHITGKKRKREPEPTSEEERPHKKSKLDNVFSLRLWEDRENALRESQQIQWLVKKANQIQDRVGREFNSWVPLPNPHRGQLKSGIVLLHEHGVIKCLYTRWGQVQLVWNLIEERRKKEFERQFLKHVKIRKIKPYRIIKADDSYNQQWYEITDVNGEPCTKSQKDRITHSKEDLRDSWYRLRKE